MWIDHAFPVISADGYHVSSPPTDLYNCIAWAAGDDSGWWSHLPGYRWPAERTESIESLISVFVNRGYEICESDGLEEGYEKVALYAVRGVWKHAARQTPNGGWTSKLGRDEDIEHTTLEGLCGALYGEVHCVMRKRQ